MTLRPPPSPQMIAQSEALYTQVRDFFWREAEADFVIRLGTGPMTDWEIIPTPTIEQMEEVRSKLSHDEASFAGFICDEGRYSFYFSDGVIFKGQFLDNLEIYCFEVRGFWEVDLRNVVEDLRRIQGS